MNSDTFCTEMLQSVKGKKKQKKRRKCCTEALIKQGHLVLCLSHLILWMRKKEISGLLCNETLFLLFVDVFSGLSFLKLGTRTQTVHAVLKQRHTRTDPALQSERKLCFFVSGDQSHGKSEFRIFQGGSLLQISEESGIASVGFLHHFSQLTTNSQNLNTTNIPLLVGTSGPAVQRRNVHFQAVFLLTTLVVMFRIFLLFF